MHIQITTKRAKNGIQLESKGRWLGTDNKAKNLNSENKLGKIKSNETTPFKLAKLQGGVTRCSGGVNIRVKILLLCPLNMSFPVWGQG